MSRGVKRSLELVRDGPLGEVVNALANAADNEDLSRRQARRDIVELSSIYVQVSVLKLIVKVFKLQK